MKMSSAVDALPIEDALDNTEQTVLKNVIGRLLGDPMARGTWEAMTQSGSQGGQLSSASMMRRLIPI